MSNFNDDTYCGIYCGACSIQMAHKTGYKDKFADYWTEANLKTYLQTPRSNRMAEKISRNHVQIFFW